MEIKESTRKYILIGLVLLIVIGLFTAKVLGKQQDEEFAMDDVLYEQVSQLYSEGKYEEAAQYSTELLQRQPDSEAVNYIGGLVAANTNEYEQASILLQKTLELNPHKVDDAVFMLQFGEVLYGAERYADAYTVLDRCRYWEWAPEEIPNYQERVAQLLIEIKPKL
ncbi:MAG: hypothetical protein ABS882_11270 [Lysinibacillus sp.]